MGQEIVKLDNGRIVLICGDCLIWLPKIKVPIDLVIADPPQRVTNQQWDQQWSTNEDYYSWHFYWTYYCKLLMCNTASLYLWQTIGSKQYSLFKIANDLTTELTFQDWITWKKSRGMGNRKGWLYTREECLWFTKTNSYIWNIDAQYDLTQPTNRKDLGYNGKPRKSQFKRYTNIWECNEDQNYGADRIREHYTPKPLGLIERIVNAHTLTANDVVLDPFLGSGTTGVACAKLNRRFIGIEKDPTYFQFAVNRIQKELENANQAYQLSG